MRPLKLKYKIIIIIFSIIIVLFILCITFFNKFVITNSTMNNYLTNKINVLPFIDYNKFMLQYPVVESNIPIYIFYHVGINTSLKKCIQDDKKYTKLINDQLNEIIYSGLYAKCEAIYYGCNGANSDVILKDFFADYKKFIPLKEAISPDTKTYENKTINAMIKFAKEKKDKFYGLYIHTKGITHSEHSRQEWRKHMEYWLINKHGVCIDSLNRGFNTVGTGLLYRYPVWSSFYIDRFLEKHFLGKVAKNTKSYCGNFFWFNSFYLKKCDYIIDLSARHNAEYFLFEKYEKNKHINLDTIRYQYLGGIVSQINFPFPINKDINIGIY